MSSVSFRIAARRLSYWSPVLWGRSRRQACIKEIHHLTNVSSLLAGERISRLGRTDNYYDWLYSVVEPISRIHGVRNYWLGRITRKLRPIPENYFHIPKIAMEQIA